MSKRKYFWYKGHWGYVKGNRFYYWWTSAFNRIGGSHYLWSIPYDVSTNTGTTTTVAKDTNVYIPATDITFSGSLFKPNTQLYAFFDGKNVSSYIQPNGSTTGAALKTDTLGYVAGVFHLPNTSSMKFVQGTKEFKLTDSPQNDTASETTYGSTYYVYSGDSDQTQSQNITANVVSEKAADPLVQTFNVVERGGIYLTGLNLYFLQKDNKYPILLQIREVINDAVSDFYLADSNYVIQPADVNADMNGATATSVTFNSPVFLQEGKEYAIYMVTNAPATYAIATCSYGQTDAYNQLSTKDPRIGTMMKYLGSSSWLRDSTKGLKFMLNKCTFDTTASYTLALDNETLSTKAIQNNSLSTKSGTNSITVTDKYHGFNAGDFVTISGLPDNTVYGGINSDYINGIHRIDSVTWNTYTFSTVVQGGTEVDIPNLATDSVIFGTNVVTDYSYQYDNLILNNAQILFSGTTLNYTFKSLSGQSLDGSETPNVFDSDWTEISNQVDYSTAKVKKISSAYNEANLNPGGGKSLQVDVTFKTNNENISPVIDRYNTNAVIVENVINNQYADELTTDNGKGIARYITKDITLAEQSNGVRVMFNANLQGSSNIRVYYKVLPVESGGTLLDCPWVEMTLDKPVQKANNDTTFNEYVYTAYDLSLFKAFKTKILMTSPDSTKPPLVIKYRAIAFQSINAEE